MILFLTKSLSLFLQDQSSINLLIISCFCLLDAFAAIYITRIFVAERTPF
ncbi:hypothetical protein X975_01653, partial [Stegodyphus mimosarum]